MPTRRRAYADAWPRLDLAGHHLSGLTLQWSYPWPSITEVFGEAVEWEWVMEAFQYQRSLVKHTCFQTVSMTSDEGFGDIAEIVRVDDEDDWLVTVTYETTGNYLPKSIQDDTGFADNVARLTEMRHAAIRATFRFPNNDALTPLVPVPFPYTPPGGGNPPFDEIWSISGSSGGDAALALPPYRFTRERPEGSHPILWLQMNFELAAPPLAETATLALDTAAAIASRFVDAPGLRAASKGKRR